jgi:epoxyqueuosine reductase
VTSLELSQAAKRHAAELGFEACGITDLSPSPTADRFNAWLERGFHGEMKYMARQAAVRREPGRAWPEAKSVVVVLHNYYSGNATISANSYRLARYAQGDDYHRVTRSKLDLLGAHLVALADHGSYRSYVDAGPLPERELAQRAGLGWMAKNTMLIHPRLGSFTFIGCVLTDLDLAPDAPFEADRCGTCTRCLDACPTGAFPEPHVLDATKCISYLTIESRSEVPAALRASVGDNLFGCDVCQEVCPWNVSFAAEAAETAFRPGPDADWPTLEEILLMDQRAFDGRFGDTAIERAGVAGLQRNARVVLENRAR